MSFLYQFIHHPKYTNKQGLEVNRVACLCKDFTYKKNLKLLEIEKISLSSLDNEDNKWLTFENIESIINKMDNINHQTMLDYYYDMFILDALIGNTDRHNGNWDILSDINNENSIYLCPIYDKIKKTESILSKTDDLMYCVMSRTQYSGPKDHNT